MTETAVTNGQAAPDSAGTTGNAPEGTQGSGSVAQTTGNGPVADAESFFDPASIQDKPELLAAYKQMQGQFTKAMQGISPHRQKIEAYDNFLRDPVGTIRQLATQYGINVVERGQETSTPTDQEFKSWDDVKKHFFDEFKREMLNPVVNEVRSLKKQSVEMQLDSQHPDWRTYEGEMLGLLKQHPTLVNNPSMLYRLAVPDNVIEARATKAAMQKLKGTTENAQVSGGTTVRQTQQAPSGPLTFDQAVEIARKKVQSMGLSRPAG